MARRVSKLMLDTNVPGVLVSAYQSDLNKIVRQMNREFQIVVSPQTHIELMNGILNGDGAYFETHKQRIRIMVGTGKISFLALPATFAFKAVLNRTIKISPLRETEFRRHVQVVLHAQSREALINGGVKLPFDRKAKRWNFNPDIHQSQHRAGIERHKTLMEQVRASEGEFPPKSVWAANIAKAVRQDLTQGQAEALGEGLDAAYEYDRKLCATVATSNYSLGNNEGDWIDNGQLFYLSDPLLHLLTDDRKLKSRASKSSKANSILMLRDFLRGRGFQVRH